MAKLLQGTADVGFQDLQDTQTKLIFNDLNGTCKLSEFTHKK